MVLSDLMTAPIAGVITIPIPIRTSAANGIMIIEGILN